VHQVHPLATPMSKVGLPPGHQSYTDNSNDLLKTVLFRISLTDGYVASWLLIYAIEISYSYLFYD